MGEFIVPEVGGKGEIREPEDGLVADYALRKNLLRWGSLRKSYILFWEHVVEFDRRIITS